MKKLSYLLGLLILLQYSNARATRKIFINGINLAQYFIANIELKCVNIKFDAKGNLYIDAPAYKFQASGKVSTPAVKNTQEAKKFYLVTFLKPSKINIGYTVDLTINGKFVKRIHAGDGQIIFDITKKLKKGKNNVAFVAKRNSGFKLKPGVFGSVKFAIAKGFESKGTYVIRKILWTVKRTTSDKKTSYFDKKIIKK